MFKIHNEEIIENTFQEKLDAVGLLSLEDLNCTNSIILEKMKASNLFVDKCFDDINKLSNIYKLIGTEGINITLASMLEEIIPNYITEEVPLSAFTKYPSNIKLDYSLESIDNFISNVTKFSAYYK